MDNCSYNKTKILYKLAKLSYFIDSFAQEDANECNTQCSDLLHNIKSELNKLSEVLKKEICKD